MTCPKCGNDNVNVQMVQGSAKTKANSRGCLWELGRLCMIFCTCGLWLLVGKSKGKANTKIKSETMCICQTCGNTWKI